VEKFKISFAGAGRVGSALCLKFFEDGHSLLKIVTPSPGRGKSLAAKVGAEWGSLPVFPEDTGILIVSVPDHRLESVLGKISCPPETIVVHTAASHGLEIFPAKILRRGVFYPLQTFTEGRRIDFRYIPFLLEASDKNTGQELENLALSLSRNVIFADAAKRSLLHVAAVFVCNFTNHLLTTGTELAQKAGFSQDILNPLIRETVSKALSGGPENSQTGPAIRNDLNTIARHIGLLEDDPELQKLYRAMTDSIINYYKLR
jgi:predicted short-subunit dehydrogenase-like oxidoreductase (DUF2520 family)